jgi:hypothetical protein
MERVTTIATVHVDPSQRSRWQTGRLAREWRTRFPDLFDDDDLRLADSQPGSHFYEWLGAIVLHHTTGYLSLVEKYEFATHLRKQQIVAQLLPESVRDLLQDRSRNRTQGPDLLMYAQDFSDWFFCEVIGPGNRLSDEQRNKFELLARETAKPIRLVEFRVERTPN